MQDNTKPAFRDVLSFTSQTACRTETIYLITTDRSRNEPRVSFEIKYPLTTKACCLRDHTCFHSRDRVTSGISKHAEECQRLIMIAVVIYQQKPNSYSSTCSDFCSKHR